VDADDLQGSPEVLCQSGGRSPGGRPNKRIRFDKPNPPIEARLCDDAWSVHGQGARRPAGRDVGRVRVGARSFSL